MKYHPIRKTLTNMLYAEAINNAGGEATAVLFEDIGHEYTDGSSIAALYYMKEFLKIALIQ